MYTKVLNTLKSQMGSAPKPFAQSAQYKKAFEADAEPDQPAEQPCVPKKKQKAMKGKKKRPDVKKLKKVEPKESVEGGASVDAQLNYEIYKPQDYMRIRKEFIDDAKKKLDLSAKAASERWNSSDQKRKLLRNVSIPELRRRRFIEKGCDHNPWADDSVA